jgi:hypothetical protein
MATVLEEYTNKEQRYVVHILCGEVLNAKNILKKIFHAYGRKCLSRKAFHNWIEKFSQERVKVANDARPIGYWLRKQSKDFYAAGFDALVKRCDKCVNVDGGYVEK